jgi:coenzyme A diphosphatase NUDT7
MRALARAAATASQLTASAGFRDRGRVPHRFHRGCGCVANDLDEWEGALGERKHPLKVGTPKKDVVAMGSHQSQSQSVASVKMHQVMARLRAHHETSCVNGTDSQPPLAVRRASVLVPLVLPTSAVAMDSFVNQMDSINPRPSKFSLANRKRKAHPDSPCVLLCTRAPGMSSHAGEVCLPGGRNDPAESDEDAALREAEEEIGLSKKNVTVLTLLPQSLSTGNVSVRPVVGFVTNSSFVPTLNPAEVHDTFVVPLEIFLKQQGYSFRDTEFTSAGKTNSIRVHYFQWEDKKIWGLTAAVLIQTAELAFGATAPFPKKPPGPGGMDITDIAGELGFTELKLVKPSSRL